MSSTTSTSEKPKDWVLCDLHKITVCKNATREERLDAYTAWASSFDADMEKLNHETPQIIAKRLFSLTNSDKVAVLDVGCGTGLLAPAILEMAKRQDVELRFDGIDFCGAMLDKARSKQLYSDLFNGDITQPLPMPDETYDFWIGGGVFADGHCEPNIIPNLSRCLKRGGYCIFTVRQKTFADAEKEYMSAFEEAQCELIEKPLMGYCNSFQAHYVVLQKKLCSPLGSETSS